MTSAESRRVPRDQIETVVKAIYAAADRLDWEHIAPSARTAQYDEWVSNADIGGVLARYMSTENARSWIKDGPMKEYARARLGAGRYAKFGSTGGPSAEQLVAHALGPHAKVLSDGAGVKPFHCLATKDSTTVYVTWGSGRNLRHLVWATINHLAENPTHNACLIILETLEHPITRAEKTRHERIAKRCSIEFKYFRAPAVRHPGRQGEGS